MFKGSSSFALTCLSWGVTLQSNADSAMIDLYGYSSPRLKDKVWRPERLEAEKASRSGGLRCESPRNVAHCVRDIFTISEHCGDFLMSQAARVAFVLATDACSELAMLMNMGRACRRRTRPRCPFAHRSFQTDRTARLSHKNGLPMPHETMIVDLRCLNLLNRPLRRTNMSIDGSRQRRLTAIPGLKGLLATKKEVKSSTFPQLQGIRTIHRFQSRY